MTTQEIRDKLMMEKAKHQAAVEKMERSSEELAKLLASVTEEDQQILRKIGIDVQNVLSIDRERCLCDADYLDAKKEEVDAVVKNLHSYLERALNV